MKRSDVLILIAIWDLLTAMGIFLAVAVGTAIIVSLSDSFPDVAQAGAIIGGSVVAALFLAYSGLSLAAGIGLLQKKEWGRILAIVHAALSLPRIPFGTIIGILSIIYLLSPETKEYFRTASS